MKTPGVFKNKVARSQKRNGQKGQSTTEYVLLLLFVVIAVKAVGGQMKDRLTKVMDAAFGKVEGEINKE